MIERLPIVETQNDTFENEKVQEDEVSDEE